MDPIHPFSELNYHLIVGYTVLVDHDDELWLVTMMGWLQTLAAFF